MYKLADSGVTRLTDNAYIPTAPGNRDWLIYQLWLDGKDEDGTDLGTGPNTPEPQFTTEDIRDQKRARIYQRLDEKLRGATVTFNGEVYGADPRNASNITSLVSLGNSGRTLPAGFKLRTRDKQRVAANKADLEALGETMFNTVYPFYTGAWDKEDELDAAADPGLVDVETW